MTEGGAVPAMLWGGRAAGGKRIGTGLDAHIEREGAPNIEEVDIYAMMLFHGTVRAIAQIHDEVYI